MEFVLRVQLLLLLLDSTDESVIGDLGEVGMWVLVLQVEIVEVENAILDTVTDQFFPEGVLGETGEVGEVLCDQEQTLTNVVGDRWLWLLQSLGFFEILLSFDDRLIQIGIVHVIILGHDIVILPKT